MLLNAFAADNAREEFVFLRGDLCKGEPFHGEEERQLGGDSVFGGFVESDRIDDALHRISDVLEVVKQATPEGFLCGAKAKSERVDAALGKLDLVEVDVFLDGDFDEFLSDFAVKRELDKRHLTFNALPVSDHDIVGE